MSNSQRGEKRTCSSCGVRFYDLARTPIVCPGCESEFSAEDFIAPRRQRVSEPPPAMPEKPVLDGSPGGYGSDKSKPAENVNATKDDSEADSEAEGEDIEGDDEDDSVIEDASELGEDDDDMAEVIVNVVEPEKTEER